MTTVSGWTSLNAPSSSQALRTLGHGRREACRYQRAHPPASPQARVRRPRREIRGDTGTRSSCSVTRPWGPPKTYVGRPLARRTRRCRSRGSPYIRTPAVLPLAESLAFARRGDDRNRTGVNGFAGRCVTTPPRRRASMRVPVASSTLRALAATVCIAVTVAAVLVAIVAWQAMDTLDRANRAVDDVSAAARRVDTRTRDLQPTVRELRDAARALSRGPRRGPLTPRVAGTLFGLPGRLADWESAASTRRRSLVRAQYRPSKKAPLNGAFSLGEAGEGFGPCPPGVLGTGSGTRGPWCGITRGFRSAPTNRQGCEAAARSAPIRR